VTGRKKRAALPPFFFFARKIFIGNKPDAHDLYAGGTQPAWNLRISLIISRRVLLALEILQRVRATSNASRHFSLTVAFRA
jgi:hypothetical protein